MVNPFLEAGDDEAARAEAEKKVEVFYQQVSADGSYTTPEGQREKFNPFTFTVRGKDNRVLPGVDALKMFNELVGIPDTSTSTESK